MVYNVLVRDVADLFDTTYKTGCCDWILTQPSKVDFTKVMTEYFDQLSAYIIIFITLIDVSYLVLFWYFTWVLSWGSGKSDKVYFLVLFLYLFLH